MLDIKWKKYSYSVTAKIIAFLLVVGCFTGLLTVFITGMGTANLNYHTLTENNFYHSNAFTNVSNEVVQNITAIIGEYKSEENILNGGSISADEMSYQEENLYREFEHTSKYYNPNMSKEENEKIFHEVYADQILQAKEKLIQDDMRSYQETLRRQAAYQGIIYYAQRDDVVYSNSPEADREYFSTNHPAYMLFDGFKQEMFPEEITFYSTNQIKAGDIIYIAFTDEFIGPHLAIWNENKAQASQSFYGLISMALGLAAAFIFLLFIIGRKREDKKIHLNSSVDKIYNDINLGLCALLIIGWIMIMAQFFRSQQPEIFYMVFIITLIIASAGLTLVLSLVKHIKNRTFIKHSLTYCVFNKVYVFIKDAFNSGSTAVKVVLTVVLYPIIAGLTFFMLPITIGVAAWLALKKVKEYDTVKEGILAVKSGDLNYQINIPGDGEFAQLAADINAITDGLNKAVENEIKSERLKSELITNVSHDLRTPLTSIITYVDLLKQETNQEKIQEYVEIVDQKAQRLKVLTDDLFEAAKASSQDMPIHFENIDIVSLITQGLGELDAKIQERQLEFKFNHPQEKMLVKADGKLLWRALENLLSNIFKYAQEGSRVYIDIEDMDNETKLTLKNISAYELNVSADELMERFKRGDEARSSQGSGLGLSIAGSLIEIQQGKFQIDIDGDLFKATILLESIK